MKQRGDAKYLAIASNYESDWQMYKRLRNYVTTFNKKKKQLYYENKIKAVKNDKKKLWSLVNGMMGQRPKSCPAYLEVEGNFLTKPVQIANYFIDYFYDKVNNLRRNMQQTSNCTSTTLISNLIMKDKKCKFKIEKVTITDVECLLNKCKGRPPGVDNLDVKFL